MNIKLIVATHKEYWMPEDDIYLPLHVGAEGKLDSSGNPLDFGFQKDNTGENISEKNSSFCELTGLYWAWKNLDADFLGLVHYRRHFTIGSRALKKYNKNFGEGNVSEQNKALNKKQQKILTGGQLKVLLRKHDVVLPKPRNYYIETNYGQYVHAHNSADLDITRDIISERYPEYLKAYDDYMKKTSGHRFNMFIMKRELFDEYAEWLFDILFELEKRIDISEYSDYDSRIFGFVSERLLDVWINTKGLDYVELPYIFMEKQNWLIKGGNFLKRKFIGK